MYTVRGYVHTAREYVHTGREHVHTAREYAHTAREYVHTVRGYVHTAREYVHTAREYVHTARIIQLLLRLPFFLRDNVTIQNTQLCAPIHHKRTVVKPATANQSRSQQMYSRLIACRIIGFIDRKPFPTFSIINIPFIMNTRFTFRILHGEWADR